MLTDEDIQKLMEMLTTKKDVDGLSSKIDKKVDGLTSGMDKKFERAFEVFATKDDIKELKQDIGGLREMVQALVVS